MTLDPHPNAVAVLDRLTKDISGILGTKLVGLYLYGSLTIGGYDDGVSDVDLLALTTEDLDDQTLKRLRNMHAQIDDDAPRWRNRIEVAYLSMTGMREFKARSNPMIIISPGEPIHRIRAGQDWLVNWYLVRSGGLALIGPSPDGFIPSISHDEFLEGVAAYAHEVAARSDKVQDRKSQSYAILTMCRAVHTLDTGEHHSKHVSAQWAQDRLPQWSELIALALERRREPDDAARLPIEADGARFLALLRDEAQRLS